MTPERAAVASWALAVAAVIALAAILQGCGCERPAAGPVVHVGEPPAGAKVVIEVARERCAFGGTVTWVDGPFDCRWDGRSCSGVQHGAPACEPLDAVVSRREPVTASALAWELGNYCNDNEDGPVVQAWAEAVNAEAARRMEAAASARAQREQP